MSYVSCKCDVCGLVALCLVIPGEFDEQSVMCDDCLRQQEDDLEAQFGALEDECDAMNAEHADDDFDDFDEDDSDLEFDDECEPDEIDLSNYEYRWM